MRLELDSSRTWTVRCQDWPGFNLGSMRPQLKVDAEVLEAEQIVPIEGGWTIRFNADFSLDCVLRTVEGGFCLEPVLRFRGQVPRIVKAIRYGGTQSSAMSDALRFGQHPDAVRVMEQSNYGGQVRSLLLPAVPPAETTGGEPGSETAHRQQVSQGFTVIYDRRSRKALLAGFESAERWSGVFRLEQDAAGKPVGWFVEYDTGEVRMEPGESWTMEPLLLKIGDDPWCLLEEFADRAAARHPIDVSPRPPVSWCGWYPYRLGETADRLMETAQIAAVRLKPLGLSIIEADLGWEKDWLPNEFEENEQFAEGLGVLAERLRKLGLELGVWTAPFMISEFSALYREHPEWMIPGEDGLPRSIWTWFWEPHGRVFILDLSHPQVRAWVAENIRKLHDKGVRYFKFDFIGCVSGYEALRRHDPRMVTGGGTEAARKMAALIRGAAGDAQILNCGGPEMPGTGHWPLLYVCQDTGNTGLIKPDFQSANHQALSCHLFKNRRWGWIQPSCLCVGLPGTLEEARLRATVAFLAGGQVDISDTLTTLPEERWRILQVTLPVLEHTAKPIDLFDSIDYSDRYDYAATCKGEAGAGVQAQESLPGSVWHLQVKSDWDEWDLVAFFSFETTSRDTDPKVVRFGLPLSRLGLDDRDMVMAYEFWDGQALGTLPGGRRNVKGYRHPGDFQDLLMGTDPGRLEISYSGFGCKLICLRRRRSHPWVIGTGFHQSCGCELSGVTWSEATGELTGFLNRPAGETGNLVLDGAGHTPVEARVGGRMARLRPGANGSWILSIQTETDITPWSIRFAKG